MRAIVNLELSHFKAFEDSVKFQCEGKNLLMFGENGSGKTSFFEAMKFAFFHNRLENAVVVASDTPEDAHEKRKQLYESFRNAKDKAVRFTIKLNNEDYMSLTRSDYKVFLVTHDDFNLHNDCILLEDILGQLFFDYDGIAVQDLLQSISDDLVSAVNDSLTQHFSETVKLVVDKGDKFRCVLSDLDGKLKYGTHLSHYFNEGKIHLILIIIYINIFLLIADKRKKNILVLDDIITSLDATNRAFVLRFLFASTKKQESLQWFILTHNVSYYNLTKYYIYKFLPDAERNQWKFYNLYNLGDAHKLYPQDDDTIEKIEHEFSTGASPLDSLGNRIRQLFEIQVHELAKIIISGGIEESKDILGRLTKGKPVYFKGGKNIYDLVSTLDDIAKFSTYDREALANKIVTTISEYKNDPELNNIRTLLNQMILFQKVSLHPTSHGTLGLTPVSEKELKESIQLVKKIEACFGELKDKNVTNI